MLREFFAWWLRQMRALTPERLRRKTAPDAIIIAIEAGDDAVLPAAGVVLARRGGRERVIGPLNAALAVASRRSLRSLPVGLRLPAAAVLHRDVGLPLAAERHLSKVLGYDMDRLTPFDASEVFWGVGGLRRDPARGLLLTLIVVLRAPVERLLAALSGMNLKPAFVETPEGRIELAAADASARVLRGLAYGVCAGLALLCVAIPVLRQQAALDRTARQIAALTPARQEAAQLRQRLAIAASGAAAVATARRDGDPLQVLAALTAALPDGTSLADLTLKSGDLTIDGQSGDAAGLIGRLAATSAFLNPRFIAPVTRAVDGRTELFSINMTIAP